MLFICNLSPSIKTYSCDWLVSAHRQCKANLKLRAVRKTNTLHMDIKIYMNAYTYLHSLCFGNVLVYVLACLKEWSYVKTQLPNDQIRSKLCIATRGNVSRQAFWRYLELQRKKKTRTVNGAFWRFLELQRKKWKRCL